MALGRYCSPRSSSWEKGCSYQAIRWGYQGEAISPCHCCRNRTLPTKSDETYGSEKVSPQEQSEAIHQSTFFIFVSSGLNLSTLHWHNPFNFQVINYSHLFPTRYALELEGLKGAVAIEFFKDASQRENAKKTIKKLFEDHYTSGKNKWFFEALRVSSRLFFLRFSLNMGCHSSDPYAQNTLYALMTMLAWRSDMRRIHQASLLSIWRWLVELRFKYLFRRSSPATQGSLLSSYSPLPQNHTLFPFLILTTWILLLYLLSHVGPPNNEELKDNLPIVLIIADQLRVSLPDAWWLCLLSTKSFNFSACCNSPQASPYFSSTHLAVWAAWERWLTSLPFDE